MLMLLLRLMKRWNWRRHVELRILRAGVGFMSGFETSVTNDVGLRLLRLHVGLRQVERRMGELARRTIWTESDEVIDTQDASGVPMATGRSVPAKAAVVPRTVSDFGRRVDVLEGALLVQTGAEFLVEVALGHLRHVVLVEKLAVVAFLTQTS